MAHLSILSFEASRPLKARLVRCSAWRSIVVFSPERLFGLCSPLYCSRFGTMRLAYLLQVVSAVCVRALTLQLHAQMPQWLPAWQLEFGLSGFRALAPSPSLAERAVPDRSCTASIATFDPLRAGGQNEVDELSIELNSVTPSYATLVRVNACWEPFRCARQRARRNRCSPCVESPPTAALPWQEDDDDASSARRPSPATARRWHP